MTVAQLRETYIAAGRLRSIYFHFPILAQESATAAEWTECAGEQGTESFWGFVDGVYELEDGISDESLGGLATSLGLDDVAMDACLASGRHNATWQIDRARGEAMGVQSTPTIFLAYVDESGEEVRLQFAGYRDYDNISQILDAILRDIAQ